MEPRTKLDHLDYRILRILQRNGRITNAKLAKEVGLSAPTVLERVKKLENAGVIKEYRAVLDPTKLGKHFIVYTAIEVQVMELGKVESLEETIRAFPEVLACYHLAGHLDFLLKVCVSDQLTYKHFITNVLSKVKGIKSIQSWVILGTVKDSNEIIFSEGELETL
jgi:Lrp/AsnC family leucine-responsive transcriptional regulator